MALWYTLPLRRHPSQHQMRRTNDNVFRLIDNSIIVVKNIFSENSILYIKGNMYGNTRSLFSIPCDSEKFNILCLIDEKCTSDLVTLLVSKIARKCLILQHPEKTVSRVVIPLLHYNNWIKSHQSSRLSIEIYSNLLFPFLLYSLLFGDRVGRLPYMIDSQYGLYCGHIRWSDHFRSIF